MIGGVIDLFKGLFGGIKDFFGGIGNMIGGLFDKNNTIEVAAHAAGGIFTQPHIAQIAEAGAEAVVPLNRSSQGFAIWKQAGELGGYLKNAAAQAPAIAAAAPAVQAAAAPPVKSPETSPVMAAAAQKIASSNTEIRVEFKMTNNFNGGAPNTETVHQLSAAGRQAGDIEVKELTKLKTKNLDVEVEEHTNILSKTYHLGVVETITEEAGGNINRTSGANITEIAAGTHTNNG